MSSSCSHELWISLWPYSTHLEDSLRVHREYDFGSIYLELYDFGSIYLELFTRTWVSLLWTAIPMNRCPKEDWNQFLSLFLHGWSPTQGYDAGLGLMTLCRQRSACNYTTVHNHYFWLKRREAWRELVFKISRQSHQYFRNYSRFYIWREKRKTDSVFLHSLTELAPNTNFKFLKKKVFFRVLDLGKLSHFLSIAPHFWRPFFKKIFCENF